MKNMIGEESLIMFNNIGKKNSGALQGYICYQLYW